MKQTTIAIVVIAALLALIIVSDAYYIVSETNQVVLTQFGEPVGGAIMTPGLHVKLPFIQKTHVFEKRWLEWDGDSNQIPTKDKKYIWVDTYARWRISDPLVFFQRVRDERGAYSRLDDIIDGETRNAIANHNLLEIVRSSNRPFETTGELQEVLDVVRVLEKVEVGRDEINAIILKAASAITPEYGIELRDVKLKRVNYVDDVQRKVFDRMISERKRIAERYRSEGDGKSAEIRGQREREAKRIESEAYRQGQETMGKADAEATQIYAAAYNRDPAFYQFVKTLDTYREIMGRETVLILSTDAEFLKFLRQSK